MAVDHVSETLELVRFTRLDEKFQNPSSVVAVTLERNTVCNTSVDTTVGSTLWCFKSLGEH